MRLRQSISDGYQATKPKKTVLALLDHSKAFDRVWKEAKLQMLLIALPPLATPNIK